MNNKKHVFSKKKILAVSLSNINNFKLDAYISLITNTLIGVAVFFELPVIIFFLARIGIVTPLFLRKYRKHALIIVLILSAVITPPDVASQIIVSVPIMILYEISIHVANFVIKTHTNPAKCSQNIVNI